MAITPTTTLVASPQSGSDRFFFWQIGNNLQNDWGSGPAGIFVNGSDQYVVMFHCVNFGAASGSQHWQHSVFKNGVQQDSGNEPLVINPDNATPNLYAPNICVQQIGTDLYIIYWNRSSNLEIKVFHMATDLFGSTFTSSLTPGTGPTVQTGSSGASCGGQIATYNANTDKITILSSGFSIPISGQDYQRPAFVQYEVGTDTWDSSFTILGHDNSVLLAESCYGGTALDCRGATSFPISQYDTNTPIMTIFFQSIYSDGSVSAVQATGATATGQPASCQEACGAILCTGTEFVIPYNTQRHAATLYRDGINVLRATVPLTNTLPLSWAIENVRATGGSTINVQGMRLFQVGTDLVLPYTGLTTGLGTQLACAVWSSGTWTDEATLGSPITLLMVRGTLDSEVAIITYDLTATVSDVSGTNDQGGVSNEIFSFVSLTEPDCAVPPIPLAITCPVGGGTATFGVPYSAQVVATGGSGSYVDYSITGGALPPGVTINASTGAITGIPTLSGPFSYSVTVTDSLGAMATVSAPCSIAVSSAAPTPPPSPGVDTCVPPPFIIHKFRFRQRVVGEYVDATLETPEYYESPEFSVAPGRVGELKDFILDYDVSGPGGRFDLYTDLPNHTLQIVRSMPLPVRTSRSPYVFPLEDPADTTTEDLPAGQLFKVRLYPPPAGILRLHGRAVFRARVIGVYFEGANGEVFETQDLDLAGGMGIFRDLEITAQSSAAVLVQTFTELPNQSMTLIDAQTINPSSTTTRRVPTILRLPGNCKGELQRFKLSSSGNVRVLGIKALGRRLEINGGAWTWYPIPFEATLDNWIPIQMPVRDTPEAFTWVDVPVDVIE